MKFGILYVGLLMSISATSQSNRFSQYKPVESYEVRPGILMMPRYSEAGQVCQIALQKRLYSPDGFFSDPTLESAEINKIANELAPQAERGKKITGKDMIIQSGNGMAMNTEYENVSIVTYSNSWQRQGQAVAQVIAATITWKHRKCR